MNHHQTGVFACRARVGLEGDTRKSGNVAQISFQFFYHIEITFSLVGRNEGVDVSEFGKTSDTTLYLDLEFAGVPFKFTFEKQKFQYQ